MTDKIINYSVPFYRYVSLKPGLIFHAIKICIKSRKRRHFFHFTSFCSEQSVQTVPKFRWSMSHTNLWYCILSSKLVQGRRSPQYVFQKRDKSALLFQTKLFVSVSTIWNVKQCALRHCFKTQCCKAPGALVQSVNSDWSICPLIHTYESNTP